MIKNIFDYINLNNKLVLKNRICRSATDEGVCVNGDINNTLIDIYEKLAEGGAGLVVSGMTEVSQSGLFVPGVAVAFHDDYAERLKPICDIMRKNNTAFIVQLVHSGMKSRGLPGAMLAPSDIEAAPDEYAREMSIPEIKGIVDDFAKAARKAKQAGAHGVQIHNAHGYLLSTFFSPFTNRRKDEYGGNKENRARIIIEVYDAIRQSVGDDFVVGIKTNCLDFREPSITVEECIWLLQTLADKGLDYAEISAGLIAGDEKPEQFLPKRQSNDEPMLYRITKQISEQLNIPVYSVSGWRDPLAMNKYLSQSAITGISMCMPFICEPDIVNRWNGGDLSPSKCVGCYACGKHSGFAVMCKKAPTVLKALDSFNCVIATK